MSGKGLVLVRDNLVDLAVNDAEYALQVTGITGFVAGHVADQFLNAGYQVRGSVVRMFTEAMVWLNPRAIQHHTGHESPGAHRHSKASWVGVRAGRQPDR